MGWTYLAESGDSQKPWMVMLSQWPTVRSSPMPGLFCSLGCTQGIYLLHQSGMTYSLFMEPCSHKLTLYTEDFPVRTSVVRDMARDWEESEAVYFSKSFDSWMKYDPLSSSWKTCPTFVQKDWPKPLGTFPKEGLIVGGYVYPLRKSVPHINENGGSYLPTPIATRGGYNQSPGANSKKRLSLETMARRNQWPTPTARANRDCLGERRRNSMALEPLCNQIQGTVGGTLNPMWVEWLMGYPSGWTVCEPWAMPSCRRKHGKRSSD